VIQNNFKAIIKKRRQQFVGRPGGQIKCQTMTNRVGGATSQAHSAAHWVTHI